MPDAIHIPFKCRCMPNEAVVAVRYREDGEDLLEWMDLVQQTIGAAHNILSPACMSTTMEYAKIPAPENTAGIGCAPKLDS